MKQSSIFIFHYWQGHNNGYNESRLKNETVVSGKQEMVGKGETAGPGDWPDLVTSLYNYLTPLTRYR